MSDDKAMWGVIAIIMIAVVVGGIMLGPSSSSYAPTNTVQNSTQSNTAVRVEADIAKRADELPPPILRTENELVRIELTTSEVVAEIMPGVTYKYWTYNGTVPGPMLRVLEGDDVELTLNHGTHAHADTADEFAVDMLDANGVWSPIPIAQADTGHDHGDAHMPGATGMNHDAEGHGTHSIDLHAVYGPGGGSAVTQVGHDGPKTFRFKALRPGISTCTIAPARTSRRISRTACTA